ncbi:hypothetical protein N2152v2_007965 [Parachlorella kessleri]
MPLFACFSCTARNQPGEDASETSRPTKGASEEEVRVRAGPPGEEEPPVSINLHEAAFQGDLRLIRGMLGQGVDPNDELGEEFRTPLHYAAQQGHSQAIGLLVEAGADVAARDAEGTTPLHLAAAGGHVMAVRLLLAAGALPSCTDDDGCTPLHVAAHKGQLEALENLLEAGASVRSADAAGRTALHLACEGGHEAVARTLLAHNADPTVTDDEGYTALHAAAAAGHYRMVPILLGRGASLAATTELGGTPLHVAAAKGQYEVARSLLAAGASAAAVDVDGAQPLHLAARGGHVKTIRALLSAGADASATAADGASPLHIAAINGDLESMETLLRGGSAPNKVNKHNGLAPIHVAACAGQADAVLTLISAGALADSPASGSEHKKATPLHFAVRSGSLETVQTLLSAGAHVNSVSAADRSTPLHLAAAACDPDIVQELLGAGADVAAVDKEGGTALHCLLRHWEKSKAGKASAVARALVAAGADPMKVDKKRETALTLATASGLTQLQLMLMKTVEERQLGYRPAGSPAPAGPLTPDRPGRAGPALKPQRSLSRVFSRTLSRCLSSRVDPFWMPVRGNNCTASCQAVGMQPVRCTAGKDCDLCAGEAGGQLWMGTKRSLPDVCQWVNGTAAGKPLIKTWKFGYSCGCLPANAKAAPPRADAAWTKDTAAACPAGLSPVDRLCQVKFGTPWYMGWVSDKGNCTFYYPANGKAPTPRATSVAAYGRL